MIGGACPNCYIIYEWKGGRDEKDRPRLLRNAYCKKCGRKLKRVHPMNYRNWRYVLRRDMKPEFLYLWED